MNYVMNDVMDLSQLASYLKMSKASLYHLLGAGKVPGTKVGKQWRFSKDTIDKWLAGPKRHSANVLVVEDDLLVREVVIPVLAQAGHHCVGADCVKSALTLLEEVEFDIVFLDLLLPDGTGLDVVTAAGQLRVPPDIVVVTGHPDHELVDSVRSVLPYVTVLGKPVKFEALVRLAGRAIAGKP